MKSSGRVQKNKFEVSKKTTRESNIREILLDKVNYPKGFKNQKDFAKILDCSISTVSRTFKEMHVALDTKGYYQLPKETADEERHKLLTRLFNEFHIKTLIDTELIPLKTEKGAPPLAAQRIKEFYGDEVLGAIAGEDTLLLVVGRDSKLATELKELA